MDPRLRANESCEMPGDPVRLPKKAEVVARHIAASITDRGLEPGTAMPAETDMQAELGVARSTLREALRLLETQGVLSLQAGRSPIVRRPAPDGLVNSLTLLLQFHDATFKTLLDARVMFEPPIAAEAAQRATDDDLAALHANIELARADGRRMSQRVRTEMEFHRLLAEASKNPLASVIVATIAAALVNEIAEVHVEHDFAREIESHVDIVEAVAARRPDRAETLMRGHLEELLASVETAYPTLLRRPIRWM